MTREYCTIPEQIVRVIHGQPLEGPWSLAVFRRIKEKQDSDDPYGLADKLLGTMNVKLDYPDLEYDNEEMRRGVTKTIEMSQVMYKLEIERGVNHFAVMDCISDTIRKVNGYPSSSSDLTDSDLTDSDSE